MDSEPTDKDLLSRLSTDPAAFETIETAPGESATSDRAIRDDYKWLPDTAANLSLLTPAGAVPAGFTQVPNAGAGNQGARFRCGGA
jgi:hypothetical protein